MYAAKLFVRRKKSGPTHPRDWDGNIFLRSHDLASHKPSYPTHKQMPRNRHREKEMTRLDEEIQNRTCSS